MNDLVICGWEVPLADASVKARRLELEIVLNAKQEVQALLQGDCVRLVWGEALDSADSERLSYWLHRLGARCKERIKAFATLKDAESLDSEQARRLGVSLRGRVAGWWTALGRDPAIGLRVTGNVPLPEGGCHRPEDLAAWMEQLQKEFIGQVDGLDYVGVACSLQALLDCWQGFGAQNGKEPGRIAGIGCIDDAGAPRLPKTRFYRGLLKGALCMLLVLAALAGMGLGLYGAWACKQEVEDLPKRPRIPLEHGFLYGVTSAELYEQWEKEAKVRWLPPLFSKVLDLPSHQQSTTQEDVAAWYNSTRLHLEGRLKDCMDSTKDGSCILVFDPMLQMLEWIYGGKGDVISFVQQYVKVARFGYWRWDQGKMPHAEIGAVLDKVTRHPVKFAPNEELLYKARHYLHSDAAKYWGPHVVRHITSPLPPFDEDIWRLVPDSSQIRSILADTYEEQLKNFARCAYPKWDSLAGPASTGLWAKGCEEEWKVVKEWIPEYNWEDVFLPGTVMAMLIQGDTTDVINEWNSFGEEHGWTFLEKADMDSLYELTRRIKGHSEMEGRVLKRFFSDPFDRSFEAMAQAKVDAWKKTWTEAREKWDASLGKTFPFGGDQNYADADKGAVEEWFGSKGRLERLMQELDSLGNRLDKENDYLKWRENMRSLITALATPAGDGSHISWKACAGVNTGGAWWLDGKSHALRAGKGCVSGSYSWGSGNSLMQLESGETRLRASGLWALARLAHKGKWNAGSGLRVALAVRENGLSDTLSVEWSASPYWRLFLEKGSLAVAWPKDPLYDMDKVRHQWRTYGQKFRFSE